MTPKEILIAARAKIADREHWTTGAFARAKDGLTRRPDNVDAVCWCSIGAIESIGDWRAVENSNAKILLRLAVGGSAVGFNDSHTHDEVLAVFDKAIQNAT